MLIAFSSSLLFFMQAENKQPASLGLVIIAFAIVYIVWGSTYFFIQSSEKGFPPFLLGAVRFSASGILLLLWCAIRKEILFNRRQILYAFVTGNLLLFIANGSIIWAEQVLPSSFVAVLVSAVPVWFVLLDGTNRKANLKNSKIVIGIIIGFLGVVLLFGQKLLSAMASANSSSILINMLVVVVGNICWAIGSLYSKKHSEGSVMVGAAWQMIAAALSFTILTFSTGEFSHFHVEQVSINAWLSVLYLVTMGSLAGYSAYIWLLTVRPATQVSTNAYVNPVVAVLLGVLFAGETMSGVQLLALAIILSSVFIINLDKYKRKKIIE